MSEDALEIQTDLKSSSPRVLATKVFANIGAHFGERDMFKLVEKNIEYRIEARHEHCTTKESFLNVLHF